MPEGDTIHRAARTLRRWLGGREVTAARSVRAGVDAGALVGQTVVGVEARAKHLLIRFSGGPVLHTHMKMTGSWHVYRRGERWRRAAADARFVIEADDRVAVCFTAPVVELLTAAGVDQHPALARLGPDVLANPLDREEILRRARSRPGDTPIGDLLLDQGVVGGIGNIWRSEALFLGGVDPHTPTAVIDDALLGRLIDTASALMTASVDGRAGRPRPRVYGRTGRPCPRCGTPVRSERMGQDNRMAHWCPSCQRRPPSDGRGEVPRPSH